MATTRTDLAALAKVRCYGMKAALCVEESTTRDGVATVMIEVAARHQDRVDWAHKIQLQATETELPLLACVLVGYLPRLELKRSGKGVVIERQHAKLFVSASQGRFIALPVLPGAVFELSTLVLNQLQKNHPHTDTQLLLVGLRSSAQLVQAGSAP